MSSELMRSEEIQFEKIPAKIFKTPEEACRRLAGEVAALIRERESAGQTTVIGLATGSTPVPFYRQLIRLHRDEGLSFASVVTFNLDEYFGLNPDHPESYFRFMQDQLFSHIDIPADQIHIPSGEVNREDVFASCRDYEKAIRAAGGIDLQILGIGRTGHIGFNEPGSSRESRTRMITLDPVTRQDAAADFLGIDKVPRFALTMGVGTILEARRVVLMAWGDNKAPVVAAAVEHEVTESISASFLQEHQDAGFYLDRSASSALTRVRLPWMVGRVDWDDRLIRRAVTWLSKEVSKPVLKLLDEDYNEHGMADLLTEHGRAYHLNIRIFNELQHTITGWPGGKPGASDEDRPERALPHPKRVLVLSPEPQDEVRGIGGALNRLVEQDHEVHVAFLTSGNLGVPDSAVYSFLGVLQTLGARQGSEWDHVVSYTRALLLELSDKGSFGTDTPQLRRMKSLVRREQARQACAACSAEPGHLHFLDLPFYEEGRYRRFAPGDADTKALVALCDKIQPHQIYMSGHAADPSSVGGVCYRIFLKVLRQTREGAWQNACRVWLYRAREKPLAAYEIDMAVPMSPDQLKDKHSALRHYPTEDPTAAVEVNEQLARQYDDLGLANYEAIEAFERLDLAL